MEQLYSSEHGQELTQEDKDIWGHVLQRMSPNDRMLMRRVSTFFRDLQFSSTTKLAFIHKRFKMYSDYFDVKFPGWTIFFIKEWRQVSTVAQVARSVRTVAFCYCDFGDLENTRWIRHLLHNLVSLHICHSHQVPEFDSKSEEERVRIVLATDYALMVHCSLLTEFNYETTFESEMNERAFQVLINENENLRKLTLRDELGLPVLTLEPPAWPANRWLTSITLQVREGIGEPFWNSLVNTSSESLEIFIVLWLDAPQREQNKEFVTNFKNLKDLRVSDLQDAPNKVDFTFANLQILALYFAQLIGADGLLWIIQRHPLLKVLDLGVVFHVEESLEVLCSSLKLLEALIIRINFAFTDNGVISLSSLMYLEQLTVRFDELGSVEDNQMAVVVDNLPNLRCLFYVHRVFHGLVYAAMGVKALNNSRQMYFIYEPFLEDQYDSEDIEVPNLYVMDDELTIHFHSYLERPFYHDYFFWKNIHEKGKSIETIV